MTMHGKTSVRKRRLITLLGSITLAGSTMMAATVAHAEVVTSELKGVDGNKLGKLTFTEVKTGVLIKAELRGFPSGIHALHLHETGDCDPADGFKSAGGHLAGDNEHGFLEEDGPHAGDMPNVHIPASGDLTFEVLNTFVTMGPDGNAAIQDDDGTALVMHKDADDYKSQPSGDAAKRVACAVVWKQQVP